MEYASHHRNEEIRLTYRLKKHDTQRYIWINCIGHFQKREDHELLFLNFYDISDEQETYLMNMESSHRQSILLQKILATTQTAIFWKDAQRRFLGANKAFLDYYSFPNLETILGKTDEDMGWHDNPDPFKNDEVRVIEKGESTYRVHGECISHGENRDIVASKSPLFIDGEIVGLVGSFEDVTAEYRAREQIEKLNKALMISLKNEEKANAAKADFMARMSHDMRTPLTTVIGLSNLGIDDNLNPHDVDCFIQIRDSSEYLLSLLNDILDVEKFDSGKMQKDIRVGHLSTIIRKVSTVISASAAYKDQTLLIDPAPLEDDVFIKTDGKWLEQLLINILNNAIKYTPKKGTITWKDTVEKLDDGRYLNTHVISDTGVGISKEFMKHMYEPFTQEPNKLSRSETGTGLGLAIVKNAVELLGGEIMCESEIDQGTTFTIKVPLEVATDEEIAQYNKENEGSRISKDDLKDKCILLCEDVMINADIIAKILRRYGMKIDHAIDGFEGVKMQAENHYDCILMDIRMPGMDGLTAAKKIRETDQKVPIIALSANAYKEDINKSLDAGMNAHLSKPVNTKELIDEIRKQLSLHA